MVTRLASLSVCAITVAFGQVTYISLTPSATTLEPLQARQFTPYVAGTKNQNVIWLLSPAIGSISATGLYVAPSVVDRPETITITATSAADRKKSATAKVALVPRVNISLTPERIDLKASQAKQFSPYVAGTTNRAVTWTLTPAVGTITSSGLYMPPSSIALTQTITLRATSVADPSRSAVALISLIPQISISVSPTQASVSEARTVQFTAQVSGAGNAATSWTISPKYGSISATGLYTAPAKVTTEQIVTVTATSMTDTSKMASSLVRLIPQPAPVFSCASSSITPSTTRQGEIVKIAFALAATQPVAGVEVNFVLNDSKGTAVGMASTYPGQSFQAGMSSSFGFSYNVPSTLAVGTYSVKPQVIGAGQSVGYSFSSACATSFAVNNSSLSVPIGINVSEAEYSWGTFASFEDLTYLRSNNISLIRLPISWERIQPALYGPLDLVYLKGLRDFIRSAGSMNMTVAVDIHNYGRYNRRWKEDAAANWGYVAVGKGDLIGSVAVPYTAFGDLWTKLAWELRGIPGLGYYDIMNEPYNMGGPDVWPTAAQTAINAIRSVDMQTAILVEGTQWASAYWWPYDNKNLAVTDPAKNFLYEAHLYFDRDGSGRYLESYSDSGAYPNVGADRVQPFLNWLREQGAKGFIGEFGVPNNDAKWNTVLDNFLKTIKAAGVAGTYWNYVFRSPIDPSWWPAEDQMSIRIDIPQTNPQMTVLSQNNPRI